MGERNFFILEKKNGTPKNEKKIGNFYSFKNGSYFFNFFNM